MDCFLSGSMLSSKLCVGHEGVEGDKYNSIAFTGYVN